YSSYTPGEGGRRSNPSQERRAGASRKNRSGVLPVWPCDNRAVRRLVQLRAFQEGSQIGGKFQGFLDRLPLFVRREAVNPALGDNHALKGFVAGHCGNSRLLISRRFLIRCMSASSVSMRCSSMIWSLWAATMWALREENPS